MLKPPQLPHSYKAGAQFPPQLQLLTYELLTYSNLSKREETDSNQTCLHSLSISLSSFRWQFGSSENLYLSYWQYFQWSGPLPENSRLSFLPWALFPSRYWPPPSLTLISRPCSFLISSLFIVLATSFCLSHPVWRIRQHRRVPFSAPLSHNQKTQVQIPIYSCYFWMDNAT